MARLVRGRRVKKILFLSTCVRGGGAGWSLYTFLSRIDREKFEPLLAVPDAGIFRDRYAALGMEVLEVRSMPERMTSPGSWPRQLAGLSSATTDVLRLARERRPDLIYCNNMLTKPVGWTVGAATGTPVIFHCRNIHDTAPRSIFYPALARAPWVKRVICNSRASEKPYARFVPDKTRVVYNPVDVEAFTIKREGRPASPVVSYFGNLIPRKGAVFLVEAAPQILERFPKTRFLIVGDTPVGGADEYKSRMIARARELGLESRVRFTGAVADIRPFLHRTAVVVIPSVQEPFGRVAIEAMAAGVPVVASRTGGLPEIVDHGVNGLLAPPEHPAELADAINRLLGDRAMRGRLVREGRRAVHERFSARRVARQIESIIREALPSP